MDGPTRSTGSQNQSAAVSVSPLVAFVRSFRATAVCLSLAALPLTAGASAQSPPPARCDSPHKYVGAPTASPTEDVFSAELTKPIDGALPESLRSALEKAMDEMIAASKATGIQATVAIPGQGIWAPRVDSTRRHPPPGHGRSKSTIACRPPASARCSRRR